MQRLIWALLAGALAVAFETPAQAAIYRYRAEHPTYGNIGTYTNDIQTRDGGVRVHTTVRIEVKVAFVTVYQLEADRHEQWRDGRLVDFSGTLKKNGEVTHVKGRAEGDSFVIDGPKGDITAPPGVWPANPWSTKILDATAVMSTATGRIAEPTITGRDAQTIVIDGKSVPTTHYRVLSIEPNDLWFDDSGRLVQFTTVEKDEVITLTLE